MGGGLACHALGGRGAGTGEVEEGGGGQDVCGEKEREERGEGGGGGGEGGGGGHALGGGEGVCGEKEREVAKIMSAMLQEYICITYMYMSECMYIFGGVCTEEERKRIYVC